MNYLTDDYYSTKTEWKVYQEFNESRYRIQDNELERVIAFNLQKTNWSEERFKLFDSYNFVEFDSFSGDRKSTRLNSSHIPLSRMPSSA